jgi:hypothetical protein
MRLAYHAPLGLKPGAGTEESRLKADSGLIR